MQDRHTEQTQNKKLARELVYRILSESSDDHGKVSHTHSELDTTEFWKTYATAKLTAETLHESYQSFFIKETNDNGLRSRAALDYEAVVAACQPVKRLTTQDEVRILSLEDVEYLRELTKEAEKEFHAEIKERKTQQRAEEARWSEETLKERADNINDILCLHTKTIVAALNRRMQIQAESQATSSWTRWLCCCFFSSPPIAKVSPEQVLEIAALLKGDTPFRTFIKKLSAAQKIELRNIPKSNSRLQPINATAIKQYAERLEICLDEALNDEGIRITDDILIQLERGLNWVEKERANLEVLENFTTKSHESSPRLLR